MLGRLELMVVSKGGGDLRRLWFFWNIIQFVHENTIPIHKFMMWKRVRTDENFKPFLRW